MPVWMPLLQTGNTALSAVCCGFAASPYQQLQLNGYEVHEMPVLRGV
jgi:hypothetical protein